MQPMADEVAAKERLGAWSMAINAIEYAATPGEVGWHISRLALPGLLYILVGQALLYGYGKFLLFTDMPALAWDTSYRLLEELIWIVIAVKTLTIANRRAMEVAAPRNPLDFGSGEQRTFNAEILMQWPLLLFAVLGAAWTAHHFDSYAAAAAELYDDPYVQLAATLEDVDYWQGIFDLPGIFLSLVLTIRLTGLFGRAVKGETVGLRTGWRETQHCWGRILGGMFAFYFFLAFVIAIPGFALYAFSFEFEITLQGVVYELFDSADDRYPAWTTTEWTRVAGYYVCGALISVVAIAGSAQFNAQVYRLIRQGRTDAAPDSTSSETPSSEKESGAPAQATPQGDPT